MSRAHGEGSINQRNDGRWQAALQVSGKRQTVYGKTKSEVAKKLRDIRETACKSGRLPTNGNLTLAHFLATWLEQAKTRLRTTTLADYRVIINKHVIPHIGHVRLSRLTALHVSRYETTLAQTLSKRRVRMVHDLLHKALGDALRWGLVAANVAALLEPPKRINEELALWTPEQATIFVDGMLSGRGGHTTARGIVCG